MDLSAFPSPCFILDAYRLDANLVLLRQMAQQNKVRILLALKGFACWSVFPLLAQYLDGAAAGSLHEARLAHEEMKRPVHVYAPAYVPDDMVALFAIASHMSFNSLAAYDRYAPHAQAYGISCGLRIQPGLSSAPCPHYDPGTMGSRFGLSAYELQQASPIPNLEGLHLHALCEADSYALEKVLHALYANFSAFLPTLKWLNLGGGHLLTDKNYNRSHLQTLLADMHRKYPQLTIFLEPSSAIAWQAGVLKTTVLDIVTQDRLRTAILDISFSCHLPDCLEMPYRPMLQGASLIPNAKHPHAYRLGGLSCLAGDYLNAYGFPQPLKVGDTLVFEDMMHYTNVKNTHFNGLTPPTLAIWSQHKGAQILRRFAYNDYKDRLGATSS